jgi:RNA polymerase sigma factor (sigma-70 family)
MRRRRWDLQQEGDRRGESDRSVGSWRDLLDSLAVAVDRVRRGFHLSTVESEFVFDHVLDRLLRGPLLPYAAPEATAAYIRRVATRRAIRLLEGRAHRVISLDAQADPAVPGSPPEAESEQAESRPVFDLRSGDALRAAVASLTPLQAEILTQRVVLGLSIHEIARRRGKTRKAIRQTIARALRSIASASPRPRLRPPGTDGPALRP